MSRRRGALRIGTSGCHYDHWKGRFYPQDLAKAAWFSHYARHFDTVEINSTFYRLPRKETFDGWKAQSPEGFWYALKFGRYGSHVVRLKKPRGTIRIFLTRAGSAAFRQFNPLQYLRQIGIVPKNAGLLLARMIQRFIFRPRDARAESKFLSFLKRRARTRERAGSR